MATISNILVASDFSQPAEAALQNALRIARGSGASLTLLHVATIFEGDFSGERIATLKSLYQRLEKKAALEISSHLAGIDSKGVTLHTAVRSGFNAAEEILTFIKKNHIDLVALGSQGRKPLSEWILGSVADKIVRMAPCPVLTVRQTAQNPTDKTGYGHIVVATDFSPNSQKALQMANTLANREARIDVIHVLDDSFLAHYGASGMAALMPDLQRRAAETLEQFAARGLTPGRKGRRILEMGAVSDKILEYAQGSHADLITVGQRSRVTEEPIMLGSVSQHLVQRSRLPVLVVK